MLNGKVIDIAPYLVRPSLADGLNREDLAALLEQLKGLEGRVMARLLLGATEQPTSAESADGDSLLTVDEAATKLKVSRDWLYRHADRLAFTVRLGPGHLRFSSRGIERYIRQRQGARKA